MFPEWQRFIFLCWKITVTTMCCCRQQSARQYQVISPVDISLSYFSLNYENHESKMTEGHYHSQSVKTFSSLSMCQHFDIKPLKYRIYFQVTCSICCCQCYQFTKERFHLIRFSESLKLVQKGGVIRVQTSSEILSWRFFFNFIHKSC